MKSWRAVGCGSGVRSREHPPLLAVRARRRFDEEGGSNLHATSLLLPIALAAPPDGPITDVELVCLEHLDVGFTASPQEIARRQKLHLDHAIALCLERPDFRWTVESIWQLEEWLARTPDPAARAAFVDLVKQRRIEVQAGFANFHTGAMDAELLLRCFEPADAIRRELGIEITSCVQDDVPGFCALLPTAMAGSGVRCFLAGINTTFGGGTSLGPSKNPFWWEGLDGSRVLTWVAYGSYVEAEKLGLGVWSKDEESEAQLTAALRILKESGYARSRVLVMASTGDNGDPDAARSILRKVDAWNAKHKDVRVSFTTPAAFLSSLERDAIAATGREDGGFPVARGDWSGHWEPVKNSAPAGLARFRDAEALLPGCEALSLRASRELGFPYPQHELDDAFRKLLLCAEHSWPGGVGWPKLTTKAEVEATAEFDFELASSANETLNRLVDRVIRAYAERFPISDGAWLANPTPFEQETPAWSLSIEGRLHGASSWSDFDGGVAVLSHSGAVAPLEPKIHKLTASRSSRWPSRPGGLASSFPIPDEAGAGPEGLAFTVELMDELPNPEIDPVRLLAHVQPFAGTAISSLRWTTAGGVIGPGDFLPGPLPRSFCTSGAIELFRASPHADDLFGSELILLREPYCFQLGKAGWLGEPQLQDASDVWVQLLDRPVRGETRDQGVVAFVRVEPTRSRLEFHASHERRGKPTRPGSLDADLMRAAWSFRCPTIKFLVPDRAVAPIGRTDVSSAAAFVTVSDENVLPLQCRPARRGDAQDVILQLQEIGGIPVANAEVTLALEDLAVARRCDLLERPLPGDPLPARPLRVSLRPHEVATFRLSPR